MTGYEWAWAGWALVALGSFFALEVPGIRNRSRRMDTFTESLRRWFGFADPANGRRRVWWRELLWVMLAPGGVLALTLHLLDLI